MPAVRPRQTDPHGSILEVDRRQIQGHELAQAQAGRIEQLHDGLVSHRQGVVDPKTQQAPHLIDVQRRRQTFRDFRCAHFLCGIARGRALANQKVVERA
jgi:hypothetical protein